MANRTQEAVITGEQLAQWQTSMELADKAAAHELGISRPHLNRLKKGHTPISQKTYNAMVGVEALRTGFIPLLKSQQD